MKHREIVQLEEQGRLIIGVDRVMARKFYIDIPISRIEKETGEAPYLTTKMTYNPLKAKNL
jgi:hypothetical protein